MRKNYLKLKPAFASKKFREIEGIVIGALNADQLRQSIKSSKQRILINFKPVNNNKLINVLLW